MTELMGMWAVTQSPSDYPGKFVARKWLIGIGTVAATAELHVEDTLDEVRDKLPRDLILIPRHPNDDPAIVESWI